MPSLKLYGEMEGLNKYRERYSGRVSKAVKVLQREGFLPFLVRFVHYLKRLGFRTVTPIMKSALKNKYFCYQGQKLKYLAHRHNISWATERAVEVPIVLHHLRQQLKQLKTGNILEVGAVLRHYYPMLPGVVLDKFETGAGIVNEDVINYKPSKKYDLIISISTLEHVGFDDDLKDPLGTLKAVKNLKENCLAKNGSMFITMPLGYNKDVDLLIFNNQFGFANETYLKKTRFFNRWQEVRKDQAKVNYSFDHARAIVVGIIK